MSENRLRSLERPRDPTNWVPVEPGPAHTNGLLELRTRYYTPTLQRFLSEDPLGLAAGDINLYAYTGSSPLNKTDATGLRTASGVVVGGASVAGRKDLPLNFLASGLGGGLGSAPSEPPSPAIELRPVGAPPACIRAADGKLWCLNGGTYQETGGFNWRAYLEQCLINGSVAGIANALDVPGGSAIGGFAVSCAEVINARLIGHIFGETYGDLAEVTSIVRSSYKLVQLPGEGIVYVGGQVWKGILQLP